MQYYSVYFGTVYIYIRSIYILVASELGVSEGIDRFPLPQGTLTLSINYRRHPLSISFEFP